MLKANPQTIERFLGRVSFGMPERSKSIANVILVDIRHRHLAQLWQNIQFKRRPSTARLAITLQFGLAALKRIDGNVIQNKQIRAASRRSFWRCLMGSISCAANVRHLAADSRASFIDKDGYEPKPISRRRP